MKRYKITRFGFLPVETEAESAQEACQKVGWTIDDCIIQELEPPPHTEVTVSHFPACDLCIAETVIPAPTLYRAAYDGKTVMGPWAYMCENHFKQYGIGLGLGKGQKLKVS